MGVRRVVRRWMLLGVAVPAAAALADRMGRRLEAQRGRDVWSRGLRGGAAGLRRLQPGRRAR
ncbi:MAG TPA: hypothetical protein VKX24_10150 [Acidimicrobiia bacterium]|nr:hypothetical protein [Acidimicrobiia bacterium]